MVDAGEADDKIVAVLASDPFFATVNDLSEVPVNVVDRLDHYFRTYKQERASPSTVTIEDLYGRVQAEAVVSAAMADYSETFG